MLFELGVYFYMLRYCARNKVRLISLLTIIVYTLGATLPGFLSSSWASSTSANQVTKGLIKDDFQGDLKKQKNKEEVKKADKSKMMKTASKAQLPFIANAGQIKDKRVKFSATTFAGEVFVTDQGEIVYHLPKTEKEADIKTKLNRKEAKNRLERTAPEKSSQSKDNKGWVLKESLVGIGDKQLSPKGNHKSSTNVNFFRGKNQQEWLTDIEAYRSVDYGEVYDGIDLSLRAYGSNVEKIFTVNPGAKVQDIKVKIDGGTSLQINQQGELEVGTGYGVVKFSEPVAYQRKNGIKEKVEVGYYIKDGYYGFEVGNYDKTRPLIIDPLLASSFLGGIDASTYINSVIVDDHGNVYVVGVTDYPWFPDNVGLYDLSTGGMEGFIAKFNNDLSDIVAFAYIGGNNYEDIASIDIDQNGNIYVAGQTWSTDFPTTTGAYKSGTETTSAEGFIAKFSSNLDILLASTLIGGDRSDGVTSLLVNSGEVFITGDTYSSDFPSTNGELYKHTNGINVNGFVARLDDKLENLLCSSYFGGSANEYHSEIAIDKNGHIFITGDTTSADLPTTQGAYDQSYNNEFDVFISRFNWSLQLLNSTYVGGSDGESVYSLVIDDNGDVLISGHTTSEDYPTTVDAFDRVFDRSLNGQNGNFDEDIFVSKFDNSLSTLKASTFIGGDGHDYNGELTIDRSGNVYITGCTESEDFPVTLGSYDQSYNGWSDGFISLLDSELTGLYASTFIGGDDDDDLPWAITLDKNGNVYIVGSTYSYDYPTTVNAYDRYYSGWDESFISKFSPGLSVDPISGLNAAGKLSAFSLDDIDRLLSFVADPVDSATGAYFDEQTPITVTGAIPISFSMSYNSLLLNEGSMGIGWGHNFETRLESLPNEDVVVHWNANRANRFIYNGFDEFVSMDKATLFDNLEKNEDGSYSLYRRDQSIHNFNANGQLTEYKNGHGQSLKMVMMRQVD